MTLWSRLRSWLQPTLHRSGMENEMETELHFHLKSFAGDLMRGGVSREEAFRRARLEFGGIEKRKEECQDARGVNSVSQRTREVGIRIALGANRHDVFGLVLGETCRLALLGSAVGCAAAHALGRLAMNQVYLAPSVASSQIQSGSLSPAEFVLSSLFLFGVAVCASYAPARRALRVDPMIALRHE